MIQKLILFSILFCVGKIAFSQPLATFVFGHSDTVCASNDDNTFVDMNGSTDSLIIKWGDGSIDTLDPYVLEGFHSYSTIGDYIVRVIAYESGMYDSTEQTIYVAFEPPIANFDYSLSCDTLGTGYTVLFNDLSSVPPPLSVDFWAWQFNDNSNPVFQQNPSHNFAYTSNNYNVRFEVSVSTYGSCSNDTTMVIPTPLPQNTADFNYTDGCPCNEITFNNTSNGTINNSEWYWNFGNGDTSIITSPSSITYNQPGGYLVSLNRRDENGCFHSISKRIKVCAGEFDTTKCNTNWHAGYNVGVSFANGIPTASNSSIYSGEACATVSDPVTGNLLFYSNGRNIWNSNHDTLLNGDSLKGIDNATQGALIVPHPINDQQYYLFTQSGATGVAPTNQGLYYNIVDMSGDNGLGEVIIKNIPIDTPGNRSEHLTGTIRTPATCSNNAEYWVAALDTVGSIWNIKLYLIQNNTVVLFNQYSTGLVFGEIGSSGTATFSPDGSKFVFTRYNPSKGFVLLDFNKITGTFSNQKDIDLPVGAYSYGCGFSPDGRKLYIQSQSSGILQYDVTQTSVADIQASKDTIVRTLSYNYSFHTGDDGRLYFPNPSSYYYPNGYLNVLSNPNNSGNSAYTEYNAVALNGRVNYSLQNLVPKYIPVRAKKDTPTAMFSYQQNCTNTSAQFTNLSDSTLPYQSNTCGFYEDSITYYWYFGDSTDTTYSRTYDNGQTTSINTIHLYQDTGTYSVTLIVSSTFHCYTDTFISNVSISEPSSISVTANIESSCFGDSATFTATILDSSHPYSIDWTEPVISSENPLTTAIDQELIQPVSFTLYDSVLNCIFNFTDTFQLELFESENCLIFIPNAFSPNSILPSNKLFKLTNKNIEALNITVINKFGTKVYESNDAANNGWDGTYNGTQMPSGVYLYHIHVQYKGGKEFNYSGNLLKID